MSIISEQIPELSQKQAGHLNNYEGSEPENLKVDEKKTDSGELSQKQMTQLESYQNDVIQGNV